MPEASFGRWEVLSRCGRVVPEPSMLREEQIQQPGDGQATHAGIKLSVDGRIMRLRPENLVNARYHGRL